MYTFGVKGFMNRVMTTDYIDKSTPTVSFVGDVPIEALILTTALAMVKKTVVITNRLAVNFEMQGITKCVYLELQYTEEDRANNGGYRIQVAKQFVVSFFKNALFTDLSKSLDVYIDALGAEYYKSLDKIVSQRAAETHADKDAQALSTISVCVNDIVVGVSYVCTSERCYSAQLVER